MVIADCWLLIAAILSVNTTSSNFGSHHAAEDSARPNAREKNTIHIIWSCISWWHSSFTLYTDIQIYKYRMIYIILYIFLIYSGYWRCATFPLQPLKKIGGHEPSEPSKGPTPKTSRIASALVHSQHFPGEVTDRVWHPAAQCPAQSFTMAFGTPGGRAFGRDGPSRPGNEMQRNSRNAALENTNLR